MDHLLQYAEFLLAPLVFIVPFLVTIYVRMSLRARAISVFLTIGSIPLAVGLVLQGLGHLSGLVMESLVFFLVPIMLIIGIIVSWVYFRTWERYREFLLNEHVTFPDARRRKWMSNFYDIDSSMLEPKE